MRPITTEWLKAANDDLMVIKKIISDSYLTHMVAFHAQQAIEKTLKAILEENEIEIPKIHKLRTLIEKVEDKVKSQLQIDYKIIKLLDGLYIESRYPGDVGLLPNGKPSIKEAMGFYEFARKIYSKALEIIDNSES